jgi:hypothetical protein
MASLIQLGNVQLLPVKEAAEFVPYSRDYVARLAREGKVVATQIDRQWFVDVVSLQNFFTHATIEESVRKRHLSSLRKRDLEVRDVYRARLAEIVDKRNAVHRAALRKTGAVVLCGLFAGFIFIFANESHTPESVVSFAQTLTHGRVDDAAVVKSVTDASVLPGVNNPVVETDSSFDVSRGIVVLPSASSSSSTVEDFFSDPVTVEMTSTTSGSIRNTVSNKAIPFVRVPTEAVVVSQKSGGNTVTP